MMASRLKTACVSPSAFHAYARDAAQSSPHTVAPFPWKPEPERAAEDAGCKPPDEGDAEQRPEDGSLRIVPGKRRQSEPDTDKRAHGERTYYESPVAFFRLILSFLVCKGRLRARDG